MATNFGAEATAISSTPNAVTPKEGVVKEPILLEGLTNIFESAGEALKANRANKSATAISDFTKRQITVATALEQNPNMTQGQARTLLRNNLLQAIEANPNIDPGDFIKIQNGLQNIAGGTNVISDGTKQQQRKDKLFGTLVQEGYISPNASDEDFELAATRKQRDQSIDRTFSQEMTLINLELGKDNLSTSRRTELESQQKSVMQKQLINRAPSELEKMSNTLDQILNSDGVEAGDKIGMMEAVFTNLVAENLQAASVLDKTLLDFYQEPFERMKDNFVAAANGERNLAAVTNENKLILERFKNVLLQDEGLVAGVATSEMFKGDSFVQLIASSPQITDKILKILGDNNKAEEEVASNLLDGNPDAVKAYVDGVLKSTTDKDPKVADDAKKHLAKIIETFTDHSGTLRRDPARGKTMINLMATQAFLKARNENPELFDNIEGVKEVIDINYNDEVMGLVRREFRDKKISRAPEDNSVFEEFKKKGKFPLPKDEPFRQFAPEAVATRATINGMEFFAVDPENKTALSKARELNGKDGLASVINNMIKASAHLEGNSNYGKLWETLQDDILGGETAIPAGGDEGDDLELSDFRSGVIDEEPLGTEEIETSLLGNITGGGFQSAPIMKSVDGMIIHHSAGRGGVSGVVSTLQDRNLSVQFVIDRDGIVHQLMADNESARHAGKNNNTGFTNKNTLGVEIIGKDDKDILPIQVAAARRLIKTMSIKHGFDPQTNVFGHGEVATHKRPTEGRTVISSIRSSG